MPTDVMAEARKLEEALKQPTEETMTPTPQAAWKSTPTPGEDAARRLTGERKA